MSVYLTIAVSVERYISVVYPLISIRLHCHHSYLYLSLPAILFSIVFTLPNYFMLHTNCDQVSYFYFIHQLYLSEKSSCAINYFLSFAKYFSMIITTQGMKWTSLKRLDFSKKMPFLCLFSQCQLFTNESEYSENIWQSVTATPSEPRFVWAHWRRNHGFVTVSTIFSLEKNPGQHNKL